MIEALSVPHTEVALTIDRSLVENRVPAGVFERQRRFSTCDGCGRVFWEVSHWQCMQTLITEVLGAPGRENTE